MESWIAFGRDHLWRTLRVTPKSKLTPFIPPWSSPLILPQAETLFGDPNYIWESTNNNLGAGADPIAMPSLCFLWSRVFWRYASASSLPSSLSPFFWNVDVVIWMWYDPREASLPIPYCLVPTPFLVISFSLSLSDFVYTYGYAHEGWGKEGVNSKKRGVL